ncbi:MAG: hypothetical protein SOZ04_00300 [Bacilli bacterium]|mgnify:CR=1 FL=1|nr:hypothetical protein [Bacilli bacterium]
MINTEFYPIDHKIYLVLQRRNYNNVSYVFLGNEMDNTDFMIRKEINGNLEPLETMDELYEIAPLFIN